MSERRRYYIEQLELEQRQSRGDPIKFDEISEVARTKLAHWITQKLLAADSNDDYRVVSGLCRILGRESLRSKGKTTSWRNDIHDFVAVCSVPELLTALQLAADVAVNSAHRVSRERGEDALPRLSTVRVLVGEIDALLGDEFLGYRLSMDRKNRAVVTRIDNELLHREVVDKTFQVTAHIDFASASNDYADAWRKYSKGDFDDAILDCCKALESAEKVILKKIDPAMNVDVPAAQLAQALLDKSVFPSRLQTFHAQLRTIFAQSVGSVRNDAGIGHGSADLVSPEAALALLVLNLTGSLIVFLVQAYERR